MTPNTKHLAQLFERASPHTQTFLRSVLEQDQADQQWAAQLGAALTQPDVAQLLNVSVQAVSRNRGLLRLTNRDGRVVYPVMQFDGRRPLPGVSMVLDVFQGVLRPLSVASWLTVVTPALDERSPLRALRDGDVDRVIALARQAARTAA